MTESPTSTSPRATSLHAARRDAELAELAAGARPDVLVVGGGVTGTAAALDATRRGLSVALIESGDLANHSPRWSDVLPDGRPRDGRPVALARARRDAVEREVLLRTIAPHLVRTVPLLVPLGSGVPRGVELGLLTRSNSANAMRVAAGTPASTLPVPRRVPAAEARALVPGLSVPGLRGGLLEFGAQLPDEARLAVALARTAAGLGARVLTRVRATRLHRDGADVLDRLGDSEIRLKARAVINAAGPRSAELVDRPPLRIFRTPGIVLDAAAVGLTATGLTAPTADDSGQAVRCVPQPGNRLLVTAGTVEPDGTPPETAERPKPSDAEAGGLLAAAAELLGPAARAADHLDSQVVSHVVPRRARSRRGVSRGAGGTTRGSADPRSREHHVHTSPAGVISVLRGALAPYRTAAVEAVDRAVRDCGLRAGNSRTAKTPLVGAAERGKLAELDAEQRLIDRYGTEAERVSAMTELDPALGEPVVPELSTSAAEVVWAVRHEGATNAEDVLDRRMPPGLSSEVRARALPRVTDLVTRALRGVYH
ncbi:glycerol-3-phosphate dehydrogenase [Actinopolyspora mzabensis]|uniref:Glycerol-3-phosphate dehydrogenase n=1 Tax=Actinopolyspora mzabensis TaxID=995066 RepID=A0A1G9C0Z8_ACTMZ|nr:FAD-dependent oxidoreductase [Actinopolyspora mzabensis]SDK45357.1 glycerol-3-phosphate dehydrogenase [Actinopolyspora mzabensis]